MLFLEDPSHTRVSFKVKHRDSYYNVSASTGSLKWLECGDLQHERICVPTSAKTSVFGSGTAYKQLSGEEPRPPPVETADLEATTAVDLVVDSVVTNTPNWVTGVESSMLGWVAAVVLNSGEVVAGDAVTTSRTTEVEVME